MQRLCGQLDENRCGYDDLDAGPDLVEPENVAVAVLLRTASLLVEVVPTHVRGDEPPGCGLGADDSRTGGYQSLVPVCLRRAAEGRFDLLASGDGDAPRVRQDQRRHGVALGDGTEVPGGERLAVTNKEASQHFAMVRHLSLRMVARTDHTTHR